MGFNKNREANIIQNNQKSSQKTHKKEKLIIKLDITFMKYVFEIKDSVFEKGIIFDKTGNFLFRMTGKRNSIDFSYNDIYRLQGKIFMHNHPRGGGFSLPDIKTACALNMAGMIVVTKKYIHIFFPPQERETFLISDYRGILKCYQIRQNIIPLSKRFLPDDEIWRIVACDLGFQYLKIKIRINKNL